MLPFFYTAFPGGEVQDIALDEDTSKHVVQVLRMAKGEKLRLTDGKGSLLTAVITDDHKKKCRVRVEAFDRQPAPERRVTVAISLLKNASRFEWFLEKATEIGVSSVVPLLCERTEKQHARIDRLRGILVSAMLQSQQAWLPEMPEPMAFSELLVRARAERGPLTQGGPQTGSLLQAGGRYIAHCLEAPRPTASLAGWRKNGGGNASQLILIGPEGDFSPKEIEAALEEGFLPVTLGDNRLRTETAGVVAATLLCIG
jgi:16S rRNA (uracil1498-N3)-methyltransferase